MRNVSVLIGTDISLFVKLWAFFIAIIEQTGASGTWSHPLVHLMTWAKIQGGGLYQQV
jgi:hypothetical protein